MDKHLAHLSVSGWHTCFYCVDTDGGGGATGAGSDGVVLVTLSLLLVGTDDGLLEEDGLVSLLS